MRPWKVKRFLWANTVSHRTFASLMTAEVDFPRGGVRTPKVNNKPSDDLFKAKKSGKIKDGKKAKTGKKASTENVDKTGEVFAKPLTTDLLSTGVRGLGIVKKINDLNVILECAGGVCVTLHGSAVSKIFTESLKTSDKTLEDIFTVGQAIAFKVLKQNELKSGKCRIDVTTCPYIVNSHLVVMNLVERLTINALVVSVEEKGVVVDFGISSQVTGFLPIDELPQFIDPPRLCAGQVLLVRIKTDATATSRVIPVSGITETMYFRDNNLELNRLMPGVILKGELENVTKSGATVVFQNNVKGFIHKIHMPASYRLNSEAEVKTVRACVMACQQNSPLLILSAINDIVCLSYPQYRVLPEKFRIGLRLNFKVHHAEENGGVYFVVENDEEENAHPILAKAPRKEIDNPEKIMAKFTKDSVHRCRIIGYRETDRLLIVSTRKEVLNKAIVDANDFIPGNVYTLTVTAVRPTGLAADCCGVACSIPAMHVKNKPMKKWERGYRIGQPMKCRFLYKNDHQKYPVFTAKPDLVESKDKIISAFDESLVSEVAMGTVIKQLEEGHLLIGFYNNVAGILRSAHAKKLSDVYIGMPLKVRVVSVKKEDHNMVLDLGEDFLDNVVTDRAPIKQKRKADNDAEDGEEPKPKRVKKCFKAAKPFVVYTAKVVGPWPYGGTSPSTSAELLLNGGTVGRLHASELDLTGYADGSKPMEKFLERNKDRTVNVKVIAVGQHKLISNEGKSKLMKDFETERFVECTMNPSKIAETRHKLNLINFKLEFHYGDVVPVFYAKPSQGNRNGEVNPAFKAIINEKEYKDFEEGTLIYGKISGVNNTTRSKCVQIGEEEGSEMDNIKTLKRSRKESLKSEFTDDNTKKPSVAKVERVGEDPYEKSKKKSSRPKFVKIQDPGFDWSTAGFTVEDLVNVGTTAKAPSDAGEGDDSTKKKKRKADPSIPLHVALESMKFDGDADFTKMIAEDPNSVEPWISCVVHFIAKENYEKAKEIIEKALKVINFKKSEDIYKIWVVYINLEVIFGTEESLKSVFEKACNAANSLQIHKHLANMYKKFSKFEEATAVYESMIKKFRFDDLEVWYLYGEHLLEMNEPEKCRDLLQRALQSLEKKHHVTILCRFAQLEYKHGDAQRGRTMFEKIVHTYEKKLQAWNLFVDMALKYEGIEEARKVFDRAITAVGAEKAKSLLKKWMEAEQKFGDSESQNLVRNRMSSVVKNLEKEDDL